MEAEVRLAGATSEGCDLFAGCHLRLSAQGIRLVDGEEEEEVHTGSRPASEEAGRTGRRSKLSRLDTSEWHRFRVVRADGEIVVFVDGRPCCGSGPGHTKTALSASAAICPLNHFGEAYGPQSRTGTGTVSTGPGGRTKGSIRTNSGGIEWFCWMPQLTPGTATGTRWRMARLSSPTIPTGRFTTRPRGWARSHTSGHIESAKRS